MIGLCAPATLEASTCASRTDFDTVLYAYAAPDCCGPASLGLGCNDDGGTCGTFPSASELVFDGRKGINFLWIDGWSAADHGEFILDVNWH